MNPREDETVNDIFDRPRIRSFFNYNNSIK